MPPPVRPRWRLRAALLPLVALLLCTSVDFGAKAASSQVLKVPILMYHYIRVNPVASDQTGFSLSVTPTDFDAQMSYLYNHGAHTVTFDDLWASINNGSALPTNPVVLTFDDGYGDFATTAVPILAHYGFIGTNYVVSGFIGRPSYMSLDQLRQVVADGMVIGDHTVNHVSLALQTYGTAFNEIKNARVQLQQWTGQPVNDFCYPNGSYNATVESLVQKAGLREATTTNSGISESASTQFYWPRVRVSGGESLATFASSVGPMSGSAPPTQTNIYPAPAGAGYTVDSWGGVHPYNGAANLSATAYWPEWDIAKGIVLRPDREGGFVLDGFGGVHPFGTAPGIGLTAYWPGWDIARDIALDPCDATGNSGYTLDGWGGIHPFGGAPKLQTQNGYWPGQDIARAIAMAPCNSGIRRGYVLDGLGGIHGFSSSGSAPNASGAYWPGWNIARAIAINPCDPTGTSGYTLDGWGGVHPFGNAPPPQRVQSYWPGWDIARGLTSVSCSSGLVTGDVLDGWGGLHPFSTGGGAPPVPTSTGFMPGQDLARGASG